MYGERGESIYHLTSECGKLAQGEYKQRHDDVAQYVHWQLFQYAEIGHVTGDTNISQNV